jgi:CD2 antigen cytoplasmic tail-binding protein 2
MSGGSSSSCSTGKRSLQEDDDNSTNNPPAKRPRFPKGKKGKPVNVIDEKVIVEENVNDLSNPVVVAKERMKCSNQITVELLTEEK